MAAIDSLLRLLASQNADALIVATDQAPRLLRAGAPQPLSMPPIGAPMMETFLGEVLGGEERGRVEREGSLAAAYNEFELTAKKTPTGWSLAFKRRPKARGGAAAAAAAVPASAAAAAPGPAAVPASDAVAAAGAGAGAGAAPVAIAAAVAAPVAVAAPHPAAAAQLDTWLAAALAERASDLIVSAGLGARVRVANQVRPLPGAPLDDAALLALFAPALTPAHHAALAQRGATDFAWVWEDHHGEPARFRANLFRHQRGLAVALRPIARRPPALAELGLPASLSRLTAFPNGLVLVVGPTGSGKTTTLASLVDQLGQKAARHVITLEDPIEYELAPERGLVHQREVGSHVDSFAHGLTAALREAPDVILVGEMRDPETIAAALSAAETGHLVLSTLHAAGAGMAIDRIVDAFPEHQHKQVRGQLAGCLRAVLTQHLVATITPGRRVPAVELLLSTSAVATLIREGRTHQLASTIQTGRDDGMIPLDRSLAERVQAGEVALETAAALTSDGGLQLRELLRRRA